MSRPSRPATYADIEALPAIVVGEILGGILHVHPRPALPHAVAASALGGELGPPFQRGRGGPGGWIILDEPELHLIEDVVVPDLAGWRRERVPDLTKALLPDVPLNAWFTKILADGTSRTFRPEHNAHWLRETRPIVEAFLVAKHALDMACRYARAFDEPPTVFEPGWGTVLYLFTLR